METVDTRTFRQKIHDFVTRGKEKATESYDNVKRVVSENPDKAFFVACISIPGILKMINSLIRKRMLDKESRYDECNIYDPRTGTHYYTKRPLSNRQKLNLEAEYKAGRSKGDVLKEWHML